MVGENMISNKEVKEIASDLGADLCGVASVERFDGAPQGFHPEDIFPDTKSVIVIARRFPEGPFHSSSPVPYTAVSDSILNDVIRISCDLCIELERNDGLIAVPVPSEPYEYWDDDKKEGRGILSLKHAGLLVGLGSIGRNHLLVNEKYGNRIVLGAVLLNIELESDQVNDQRFCDDNCNLCIDSCPASAISEAGVNQKLCRGNSGYLNKKGYFLYVCNACRKVCPNGAGIKFSFIAELPLDNL